MANTSDPFHKYGLQHSNGELPPFEPNPRINDPGLYIPSPGLVDAVNVALSLGQPLLLTGEPGTGKTQLAYHVARFFNLGDPEVYPAQTTSTANDLFYRYDALGHFQYAQNKDSQTLTDDDIEARFIQYNALGRAIRAGRRVVVLVDEIDKAPRDLPNDLLFSIEKLQFRVPEIKDPVTGGPRMFTAATANRPVIILTSNSEKNLPDAFLRRVVYYHISFDEVDLDAILELKTGLNAAERQAVKGYFLEKVRTQRLKKLPATAELIAWVLLLQQLSFPLEKLGGSLTEADKNALRLSFSVLAKNRDDLQAIRLLV